MSDCKANREKFDQICAAAGNCDACFAVGYARRAYIDIAQPRFVGENYWTADERRLFLMINPGAGKQTTSNKAMRDDIYAYRQQKLELSSLFHRQRSYMSEWGRSGKFLAYFRNIGCALEDIAFLNVAWCADLNDSYPDQMLDACFSKHTQKAIETLRPTSIAACGNVAQKYARRAKLQFISVPHYAARGSIDYRAIRLSLGLPSVA